MKRHVILIFALGFLSVAGDPFRNLNFEEAITNNIVFDPVSPGTGIGLVKDLLPGWEIFQGTNLLDTIGFNRNFAFGDFSNGPQLINRGPLEGNYSLSLVISPPLNTDSLKLVQRGDIPTDARFLEYTYFGWPISVTINDTKLTADFQNPGAPSTVLLDVSSFAGQNVELTFGTAISPGGGSGPHTLDAIAFLVPEPSVTAIGALAFVGFLALRLRRRKRVE